MVYPKNGNGESSPGGIEAGRDEQLEPGAFVPPERFLRMAEGRLLRQLCGQSF